MSCGRFNISQRFTQKLNPCCLAAFRDSLAFRSVRVMSDTAADGRPGFRVAQPAGTLRYMSPECFIKDTFLGAEVDIFAFGIMMYELLTGMSPYGDLPVQEIPRQVYRYGLRPVFPPLAPQPYW